MSDYEQLELPLDFGGPVIAEHEEALWAHGGIIDQLGVERLRQVEKWGQQDHPPIGRTLDDIHDREYYAAQAEQWKKRNDYRVEIGNLAWDGILLEEVFEALEKAGVDDDEYEKELVEVMAVAAAMIEANRRRRGVPHGEVRRNRRTDHHT
jgi:hypothetical protein